MQILGNMEREAMYINTSLSFIEQVILALTERNREHIPYRQCKLTHLLKDSIGGNCTTVMIANIWVEPCQIEETVRVKCIIEFLYSNPMKWGHLYTVEPLYSNTLK